MLSRSSTRSTESEPSLFGKLPHALDFVRINHDYPESIVLDRWLQTSLQRLTAHGHSWPSECLRFVLVGPAGQNALVGVIAASCDRADERFPVAVYVRTPMAALDQGAAPLPLASEIFLRDAQELLEHIAEFPSGELGLHLRRLQTPGGSDIDAAVERLDAVLAERSLDSFASELFAEAPVPRAIAAFQRIVAARSTARQWTQACSFDCPVRSLLDVTIWCQLIELSLAQAASCVWNLEPRAPRMLLSAGPLPDRVPLFWAAPRGPHAQLSKLGKLAAHGGEPVARGDERLAELFDRLIHPRR